jgi:predicted membrane-bound spermidine synthase
MFRELHWTGIVFGAATGLVASMILFALSGPLGGNLIVLIVIALAGFVTAGYIAGRFSLVHRRFAGRIAGLMQFFAVATFMIAVGARPNIFGLLLLGVLAIVGGTAGATWAEK